MKLEIKVMRNVVLLIFTVLLLSAGGCQDVTIGYLLVNDASYKPDSLVIKSEESLDIAPPTIEGPGVDYNREKWGQPWVSTPIEGIEGTAPIRVSIKNITSTSGDPDKLCEVLTVRGDGTLEIPLHHGVPVGRYVISLNFSNEGYSKDVDNCFTIIIK